MATQTFQESIDNGDSQPFAIICGKHEHKGLFSNVRIDRDSLPEGWHAYDLRHDDDYDGEICEVLNGYVIVNYFGTFCTQDPLPLQDEECLSRDPETERGDFDYTFLDPEDDDSPSKSEEDAGPRP